jgi:hypothetical protein
MRIFKKKGARGTFVYEREDVRGGGRMLLNVELCNFSEVRTHKNFN